MKGSTRNISTQYTRLTKKIKEKETKRNNVPPIEIMHLHGLLFHSYKEYMKSFKVWLSHNQDFNLTTSTTSRSPHKEMNLGKRHHSNVHRYHARLPALCQSGSSSSTSPPICHHLPYEALALQSFIVTNFFITIKKSIERKYKKYFNPIHKCQKERKTSTV